jgi:hypothetical protein
VLFVMETMDKKAMRSRNHPLPATPSCRRGSWKTDHHEMARAGEKVFREFDALPRGGLIRLSPSSGIPLAGIGSWRRKWKESSHRPPSQQQQRAPGVHLWNLSVSVGALATTSGSATLRGLRRIETLSDDATFTHPGHS